MPQNPFTTDNLIKYNTNLEKQIPDIHLVISKIELFKQKFWRYFAFVAKSFKPTAEDRVKENRKDQNMQLPTDWKLNARTGRLPEIVAAQDKSTGISPWDQPPETYPKRLPAEMRFQT